MFTTQRLFASIECPERETCKRNPCIFSHPPPVKASTSTSSASSSSSLVHKDHSQETATPNRSAPIDTPTANVLKRPASSSSGASPPRKVLKATSGSGVDATSRPTNFTPKGRTGPSAVNAGPPVLNINPATSKVPVRDRSEGLQRLYSAFVELYTEIMRREPRLASEHASAQEIEVYNKSNAQTYRTATTMAILAIRKRPRPTTLSHQSLGTESEVQARIAAAKEYPALQLTTEMLEPALLTTEQMKTWGFMVEIPEDWGPGGTKRSETGNIVKCERCQKDYTVRADPNQRGCQYHWGRIWTRKLEGRKKKIYTCCQREHPFEGCSRGCHVFYESDVEALHSRHPFTFTSADAEAETKPLDIVALDCEMIYTTAGMSVARVSIVDAKGDIVFDELVKPSEGVDPVDLNSRFSGVTSLDVATKDLHGVREALKKLIGPETIIIGHAVDNDLRTLRMVHLKVVDTIQLFIHPDGAPRRRALRDLSSEILNRKIQAGAASSGEAGMGAVGHSSVEDARATLDLVRWWICERQKKETGAR